MSAFLCWPPSWQDCLHTNHPLDMCVCLRHHCQLMYTRSCTSLTAPGQTRASEFHGTGWPRTFLPYASSVHVELGRGSLQNVQNRDSTWRLCLDRQRTSLRMKERTQRALKVVELNTSITGQGNSWGQGHSDQVQDTMV